MGTTSGFGPHVNNSINLVMQMIEEFRFAEACVFLFHLNKWHTEEWAYVKDRVLSAVDHSKLSMTATIVKCSMESDLSVCNIAIPGLAQYTQFGANPELLD